ncbi:MAG: hypothetical protein IPJ87_01455 [Flavobacteriales bacterium]|nr:hypothetical protein [Flavobacteriales bacterium]
MLDAAEIAEIFVPQVGLADGMVYDLYMKQYGHKRYAPADPLVCRPGRRSALAAVLLLCTRREGGPRPSACADTSASLAASAQQLDPGWEDHCTAPELFVERRLPGDHPGSGTGAPSYGFGLMYTGHGQPGTHRGRALRVRPYPPCRSRTVPAATSACAWAGGWAW